MRILFLAALCLAAACAPSPLYVSRSGLGSPGEVPRDARGEPRWDKIPPAPKPGKPAPAIVVNPGPPIQPGTPMGR